MRPTQSDVHVNRPLSNILVAYMQDEAQAIAHRAFPIVPVANRTDIFYKWKRDDFWRIEAAERAPGAESEGGGFELDTDTYECKEYAIHKDIEDPVRANADNELDLDAAAVRYVGGQLLLKQEQLFVSTFIQASTWTGTATGVDQTGVSGTPSTNQFKQFDQSDSDPIETIRAQMLAMKAKTGYMPNKLIVGAYVWNVLVDHADILDRIKYTQRGVVTKDLFAALLGLDEILESQMVYNSAKEGQTASYSFIDAGKSMTLLYAPPSPSLMEPTAGYTFAWTKRPGAGPRGQRIKKFRLERNESDRIEGQMNVAHKVVCADLGAHFISAVA